MNHALEFELNGIAVSLDDASPTTTLLRYLRDEARLTGTKEGCAEGDCGACTVAVAEKTLDGTVKWRAVNSCLLLLPMVQGKHVMTVEGIAKHGAHPAQLAMRDALGSQCGYCTPGIVMSLFEATYRSDLDAPEKLDDQLCGNLCRCTGYRTIREAALEVAGSCPVDAFSGSHFAPKKTMALRSRVGTQTFATPTSLPELFEVLENPEARVVVGGTDLCLEITKRFLIPTHLVSLEGLDPLKQLTESETNFSLGAASVLSELEDFSKTRMPSLHRMLRYFGSRQIKHRATLGGNVCSASPIGDLAPVLLSLGAVAVLLSARGQRRVALDKFFVGYRKTALERGEVLGAIEVPKSTPGARVVSYKVSKRRELDISSVSAGLWVLVNSAGLVESARFAFGGMAAVPARATQTEQFLIGKEWSLSNIRAARKELAKDFTPLSDHRGSAAWRLLVAQNFLDGFFMETKTQLAPALQPGHVGTVQVGVR
jgi:xanthine dehydrogenase small subunit